MSKDKDLDPSDFHVAVRRRDHTETPWYWEISAAARTKAVMSSDRHLDNVGSQQRRKSQPASLSSQALSRCITMSETRDVKDHDLDEIYDFLVSAEVVEGPPEFREIVAKLWPELLHKVKPPASEMH
jgi:hypothetical protein